MTMNRGGWSALSLLVLLAMLTSSCFLPETFQVEISIDDDDGITIDYRGTLGFLPARAEVLSGGLLSKADLAEMDEVALELVDDAGCSSARHVGEGRFSVRCERSGPAGSVVELLSSELDFFKVRPVGDGVIKFSGTELSVKDRAKLQEAGLGIEGRIRVRTALEVIDHNADREPSLLALRRYYEWTIDSLDDPAPFMRLRMGATTATVDDGPTQEERIAGTMSSLRTVAAAVESYSIDHDQYPRVPRGSIEPLRRLLEPTYIKEVPVHDGWGNPMEVTIADDAREYWLISRGSDGRPSGPARGLLEHAESDIIFSSGSFVTWHEIQRDQPSTPGSRSQHAPASPERQSMSILRAIATAMESYSIDYDEYPGGRAGTIASLRSALEPTYINPLPLVDAWGGSVRVMVADGQQTYTLTSYGSDGKRSGPSQGPLSRSSDDIILSDGSFVTWHPNP